MFKEAMAAVVKAALLLTEKVDQAGVALDKIANELGAVSFKGQQVWAA